MSLSGTPGAIGQGHAVAGLDRAVGGEREDLARAAGGEDHRLAENQTSSTPVAHVDADARRGSAVVDEQLRCTKYSS